VLWTVVDASMRLMHPMQPFVTEELWQRMPGRGIIASEPTTIMLAPYPTVASTEIYRDEKAVQAMHQVQAVVESARRLKKQYGINKKCSLFVVAGPECFDSLTKQVRDISTLSKVKATVLTTASAEADLPKYCAVAIVDEYCVVHLPLKGLLDPRKEVEKLKKKLTKVIKEKASLQELLTNDVFRSKASKEVMEKNQNQLVSLQKEESSFRKAITNFESMISLPSK